MGRFCFVVSLSDLWIGFCWERDVGVFYFAPLPALIFGFKIREPKAEVCPACVWLKREAEKERRRRHLQESIGTMESGQTKP